MNVITLRPRDLFHSGTARSCTRAYARTSRRPRCDARCRTDPRTIGGTYYISEESIEKVNMVVIQGANYANIRGLILE
jgi:hypothetical protein